MFKNRSSLKQAHSTGTFIRNVISNLKHFFKNSPLKVMLCLMLFWSLFGSATVGGDGLGYYLYYLIPLVEIIDHSLDLSMPFGTAIFAAPFYMLSLPLGKYIHYRDDAFLVLQGDVFIHSFMFTLGLQFYTLLTILIIYKMCLRVSNSKTAHLICFLSSFGSPLLFYSNGPGWPSHVVTAFLTALSLYLWVENREGKSKFYDAILGVSLASVATVRYIDGIVMLPFLGWYVLKRTYRRFMLFFLSWLGVALTIPIYWKIQYGSFFYCPQVTSVGGFSPYPIHFFHVLFSPQHGFFIFNPVFLAALFGFCLISREDFELGVICSSIFLAVSIAYGCINTQWSGAVCFGNRYLALTVPVLSLGLAAIHDRIKVWLITKLMIVAAAFSFALTVIHICGWYLNAHDSIYDYIYFILEGRPRLADIIKASNLPVYYKILKVLIYSASNPSLLFFIIAALTVLIIGILSWRHLRHLCK